MSRFNIKIGRFKVPACCLCLLISSAVRAQLLVEVTERPQRPQHTNPRPKAPEPGAIWIDEDWRPKGGSYEWNGGYYVIPPFAGAEWKGGKWDRRRRGDVWVPGHWD
jgi:hypothetical protein